MFAYLIIGVELAILYTVFWYVFIREPKPYKVDADMWGTYSYTENDMRSYDVDHSSSADRAWLESNLEVLKNLQKGNSWSQGAHQVHLPMKPVENTQQYGWIVKNSEEEAKSVAKLFGKFRNSLDTLSVKTP